MNTSMKSLKKEATDFLNKRGRRVKMIFYGLLLVFVSIAPVLFYHYSKYLMSVAISYAVELTKLITAAVSVTALAGAIILFVLLGLPVISNYFDFSYKIYREGALGKPLYLPCAKRYFKSLLYGLSIFACIAATASPLLIVIALIRPFAFHSNELIANLVSYLFVFAVVGGLALSFGVFLLLKPFFMICYYFSKGESVGRAFVMSVRAMKPKSAKRRYNAYIKSFLPALLLSLLSLLTLFLVDTLPKMTLVYYRIAEEIDCELQNKE